MPRTGRQPYATTDVLEVQKKHFEPPQFVSGDSGVSKYNRVLRRARG